MQDRSDTRADEQPRLDRAWQTHFGVLQIFCPLHPIALYELIEQILFFGRQRHMARHVGLAHHVQQ